MIETPRCAHCGRFISTTLPTVEREGTLFTLQACPNCIPAAEQALDLWIEDEEAMLEDDILREAYEAELRADYIDKIRREEIAEEIRREEEAEQRHWHDQRQAWEKWEREEEERRERERREKETDDE